MFTWQTSLGVLLRRALRESWDLLSWPPGASARRARAGAVRRLLMSGIPPGAWLRLRTSLATVWQLSGLRVMSPRRMVSALRIQWRTSSALGRDFVEALSDLRTGRAMAKPLLALNVLLGAVSIVLFICVVRAIFFAAYALPPPPAPRPMGVVASPEHDRGWSPRPASVYGPSSVYDMVATRNLFHPDRSEPTRADLATKGVTPPIKPILYGVVVSDDVGLAYLEDPATKRILGYRIGAELAGGRLERIENDRIVIRRADGLVEVLLSGLNKPRQIESTPASTAPEVRHSDPAMTPPPDMRRFGWGGAFR